MSIKAELLETLLPGKILAVQVGLSRTAVVAETDDGLRCGLAATLTNPGWDHRCRPQVRNAGHLHEMAADDLASLIESSSSTEVGIGLATVNALLPRQPEEWIDLNAEDYLIEHGSGKNVAVVGHFPFVERIKSLAKQCWVLELAPRPGDFPAESAPEIIPQAEVIAITAMTLVNQTFRGLMDLCRPEARVVLIGPSTPLSPVLFAYGVDILSGTIVTNPQLVLTGVAQGISFHQLRQEKAVRLVTMQKRNY